MTFAEDVILFSMLKTVRAQFPLHRAAGFIDGVRVIGFPNAGPALTALSSSLGALARQTAVLPSSSSPSSPSPAGLHSQRAVGVWTSWRNCQRGIFQCLLEASLSQPTWGSVLLGCPRCWVNILRDIRKSSAILVC